MMEDWTEAKLGDVCKIEKIQYQQQGLPYVGMEHIDSGTGTFLGSMEPYDVKSSTFSFTAKHVLYGRLRPYLNKVMLPSFEGHCSSEVFPLKPCNDLDRRFLFYWLTTAATVNRINDTCTGARMPRANMKEVINFDLMIPPLPEQKRVVAILDEAFKGIAAAVANAGKNLANARELFDVYFNVVFSQTGKEWAEKPVGDIADHCLGKMLDKRKNKGTPKPYLRNLNVQWFNVDLNDMLEMRFEDAEEERYTVKKGDLIICEGGYPGRAAIWEHDGSIYFQKAIHRVRCNDAVYNRWLLYFLYLSDVKNDLRKYFTGAGIQHFTGRSLKQFLFPIAPVSEIKRHLEDFDTLFEKTQRLETIYQNKLTALAELKQSFLQKAFTGELTADKETAA